jgi:hypothetical protein
MLDRMNQQATNKPAVQVISDVLWLRISDPNRSAFRAYSVLSRMIDLAEIEARRHYEAEWEVVGPPFDGVRACLTPLAAQVPWDQRRTMLVGAVLTGLQHTAIHLKRHVVEEFADDEAMRPLSDAVKEMDEALKDQTLSKRARQDLSERLDAIKDALNEYRYWGAAGIESSFLDLVGTIQTNPDVQTSLADEKQGRKIGQKLFAVVGALTLLLTFVKAVDDDLKIVLPPLERWMLPAPENQHPHTPLERVMLDATEST